MCVENVALYECKECYLQRLLPDRPGITSYCRGCNDIMHKNREDHKPRPVLIPRVYNHYNNSKEKRSLDLQKMDLFAVVCIETSHYVAFVKCGIEPNAPWCFFDSMADRKGESLFSFEWLSHDVLGASLLVIFNLSPRSNSQ